MCSISAATPLGIIIIPHINEKIVTDDLEALAKVPEQIDIFQIDDGYQTAVGDWLSTDPEKIPQWYESGCRSDP